MQCLVEVDSIPPKEVVLKSMKEEIQAKLDIINSVLYYVNKILSLLVLVIVAQSALFLRRYTQPNHTSDNIYITRRFEQVDKKRKLNGK